MSEQIGADLTLVRRGGTMGLLRAGEQALVIDPGTASSTAAVREAGCTGIVWALATHYHRDTCAGLEACRAAGARVAVPAAERHLVEGVEAHWRAPETQYHRYAFRPGTNILPRAVLVDRGLDDGDVLSWAGGTVEAVATPGHTDGSLSYVVAAGDERYAFVGDLLYGDGQFWELGSLQGPPPGHPVGVKDYHAFCGRARQAVASLEGLLDRTGPAALIPAHGPVVRDPRRALERLRERVEALLENYYSVSSMRYYFPDWTARQAGRTWPALPGVVVAPPAWWRVGPETSRVVVAPSGRALVLDCGSPAAAAQLAGRVERGEIAGVDAVWVSHYHDDHVGGLGALVAATSCAVWAGAAVADLVAHPERYALPCLEALACAVDRVLGEGEQVAWEGFRLTAYGFPGQTLLHDALLVERGDVRLLVGGDSFTPGGLDDYCAHNRNLLGAGRGYERCLDLLEEVQPTHLVNMHVESTFSLPASFLAEMRAALRRREHLVGELAPWADPSFALDPWWARCYPYRQAVPAGGEGRLTLQVTNHAPSPWEVEARPLVPPGWREGAPARAVMAARAEGGLELAFGVPPGCPAGRWVLAVEVVAGGQQLGAWSEALIDVVAPC